MKSKPKLNQTELLMATALLTAFASSLMLFIRVPLAGGYIHPGDLVILCSALLLPYRLALFVGGVSAMLADVLGGYAQFAVFSFFIKMIGVMLMYSMRQSLAGKYRMIIIVFVNMVMVFFYGLTYFFLLGGLNALWTMLPYDLIQAAVTSVLVFLLYPRVMELQPYFKGVSE